VRFPTTGTSGTTATGTVPLYVPSTTTTFLPSNPITTVSRPTTTATLPTTVPLYVPSTSASTGFVSAQPTNTVRFPTTGTSGTTATGTVPLYVPSTTTTFLPSNPITILPSNQVTTVSTQPVSSPGTTVPLYFPTTTGSTGFVSAQPTNTANFPTTGTSGTTTANTVPLYFPATAATNPIATTVSRPATTVPLYFPSTTGSTGFISAQPTNTVSFPTTGTGTTTVPLYLPTNAATTQPTTSTVPLYFPSTVSLPATTPTTTVSTNVATGSTASVPFYNPLPAAPALTVVPLYGSATRPQGTAIPLYSSAVTPTLPSLPAINTAGLVQTGVRVVQGPQGTQTIPLYSAASSAYPATFPTASTIPTGSTVPVNGPANFVPLYSVGAAATGAVPARPTSALPANFVPLYSFGATGAAPATGSVTNTPTSVLPSNFVPLYSTATQPANTVPVFTQPASNTPLYTPSVIPNNIVLQQPTPAGPFFGNNANSASNDLLSSPNNLLNPSFATAPAPAPAPVPVSAANTPDRTTSALNELVDAVNNVANVNSNGQNLAALNQLVNLANSITAANAPTPAPVPEPPVSADYVSQLQAQNAFLANQLLQQQLQGAPVQQTLLTVPTFDPFTTSQPMTPARPAVTTNLPYGTAYSGNPVAVAQNPGTVPTVGGLYFTSQTTAPLGNRL